MRYGPIDDVSNDKQLLIHYTTFEESTPIGMTPISNKKKWLIVQ